MAEQDVSRETIPLISKVKVLLMCRLGIPIDIIASILKINWKTAKNYSQDGALLRSIRDALENGLSVPDAARKITLPEPLVWAIALEGKSDKDRFDALDWKIRTWDFQSTPARDEIADNAIMIDDYLHILRKSGWQRTHIMWAPLSSERFNPGVVSAMLKKRIIGVTSRYVIVARRAG